jgi:hypothetical protein
MLSHLLSEINHQIGESESCKLVVSRSLDALMEEVGILMYSMTPRHYYCYSYKYCLRFKI